MADVRVQAGVATATATAHGTAIAIRVQAGVAAATATAYGARAITEAVAVVADTIEQAKASLADVQVLHSVLTAAVREGVEAGVAATRIEQQAPMFGAVGRWLQANQGLLTLLSLVVGIAALVGTVVQVVQDAPDQPAKDPTSQVQVDRGALTQTTEDALREQGVEITPSVVPPSTEAEQVESTPPTTATQPKPSDLPHKSDES